MTLNFKRLAVLISSSLAYATKASALPVILCEHEAEDRDLPVLAPLNISVPLSAL